MAEPSSSSSSRPSDDSPKPKTLIVIGPSPEKNKAKGKQIMTYDFTFQLKPTTKFRHSIAALGNYQLNPTRMGLLEVDESSFSINVYSVSKYEPGCEEENVFGFLKLEADFFNFFECFNPVSKMVNLEHVLLSLSIGEDDSMLSVYSIHESNQLTFEFEGTTRREIPPKPSVVDLLDVYPGYKRFPEIMYGFESSVPSAILRPLIKHLLKQPPATRPDFVTIDMQPATVRLIVGDNIVESQSEKGEVWLSWPFWEALGRATYTSEECFMYMVTEPAESMMLLFKLTDPDEMITFKRGTFSCYQKICCLAFFRSLT